ncbi:hypothetical protein [uncultured Methanobrevibacter sp.]|uniref:hypothetical protein n=1 Tax=uncultured Methanobrevibacter sp. TaxID=253161 RepID=UPI002631E9C9|nr:hypothetical protein [uncultured Methanobrevibacter sp.]
MDEVETAERIYETLYPYYNPVDEPVWFKALISAFFIQGTSSKTVEKIIINLHPLLHGHTLGVGEATDYMDSLYLEESMPNSGLDGLKNFLKEHMDSKTSIEVHTALKKIIKEYDSDTVLKYQKTTNSWIICDKRLTNVSLQTTNYKNNRDISTYTNILTCYPLELTVHDNPISEEGRIFSIQWIQGHEGNSFTTKLMTVPETETYLLNHGYVINPKEFKGTVASIVNMLIENKSAIMKTEIDTPGFYYNKNRDKIDIVDYELLDVSPQNLNNALDIIEDLVNYFPNHEGKLATTLKHSLIAPFGFAKKQMGLPLEQLIPYLYHFGKAGSGKTTLARIGAYFYTEPDSETDIGGSEFDTVARIGHQISKNTFLLIVNEPGNVFSNHSCSETLKTCVERTNARGKYHRGSFTTILALATVSFTSNQPLPVIEGLNRRFHQLLYSHSEKKTEEEKKEFMEHFKLNTPEFCLFHQLKWLAQYTVHEIIDDINLLLLDWKELANTLIVRAYASTGRECPRWLLGWSESVTLDDVDEEEVEEIRMFFIEEINKQMRQIRVYDENGFSHSLTEDSNSPVKDADDFKDRVYNVINERLIPYMLMHTSRDGVNSVCFTAGLKKALHQNNQVCYNVKSIAELLGWKYGTVKFNGNPKMVMKVKFDKFIQFLYPNLNEMEGN